MTTSAICMTARLTQCTKSSSRQAPPHLLPVPMTTSDRIPCLKANLPSIRTVIHIRQRPCPAPVYPADSSSAHVQHMLRPHQQTGRRDELEAAQRYPSDAEVASDEESLNVDIIYGDCTRSCTCGRCAQRGDLFSQDARNPYPTPPKHPDDIKFYQYGLLVHHAIHHMRQIQSHICFSFPFSGCFSLASSLAIVVWSV